MAIDARLSRIETRAYTVPTDRPEADGTFAWASTTLVVVHVTAGGETGFGYTYTDKSIVPLIDGALWKAIDGHDAMAPQAAWRKMRDAVRNMGRDGLAATAISAVDAALWDLKARLLGLPLATLLGQVNDHVPIYGSGGFTTYDDAELQEHLAGWVERDGCRWVKIKVGTDPARDPHRVAVSKRAIGDHVLFVDANGAYGRKQALHMAEVFMGQDVRWFEEPVSSDDLEGLRQIRARAPARLEVAAGEYGYDLDYFRRMLMAEAVDVLQADVTRCGGITGLLQVAAVAQAHHVGLSCHCGPALHLHPACALPGLRHLEWFHDHVRIERMLIDGAPVPKGGAIAPDPSRPGNGLTFKRQDAERFAA